MFLKYTSVIYIYDKDNNIIADIIGGVKKPSPDGQLTRPKMQSGEFPPGSYELMQKCWEERPEDRPDVNYIHRKLKAINGGK